MRKRIHLSVPYRERHRVKALGAHWDPVQARWYITSDMDSNLFQSWLKSFRSPKVRIGKIYLLTREGYCSRCRSTSKVYCLGTSHLSCSPSQEEHQGFFTLFHIVALPKDFYSELQKHCLTFFFMQQQNGNTRLENHCFCGRVIDDTLLHRPGPNSFRPVTEEQAVEIQCTALSIPVKGMIQCQWRSNPMLLPHIRALVE